MSLFAELKRRNVIRMAGLYLVGAWLIVQIAETLLPAFDVPGWVLRAIIMVLALGLVPALVFAWLFEMTPEGLKRDAEVGPRQSGSAATGRRMDLLIGVALLLVVAVMLANRFWPVNSVTPAAQSDHIANTDVPAIGEIAERSIAVLPFADMSAASDQAYLADGIAEEILNLLASVRDLSVASRTSALSMKSKGLPIPEIARQLGVRYVLDGSVRKSGDQLRISAQLIDAQSDRQIWSQTYDRTLADVFRIQDEIAAAIGAALKIQLLNRDEKSIVAESIDPRIYEKFLEARFLLRQRSPQAMEKAQALLEEVVAAEPRFASGLAVLAEAIHLRRMIGSVGQVEPLHQQAAELASRALELDSGQSLAWMVLGSIALDEGDLVAAYRNYGRGIELQPNEPRGYHWLAILLTQAGFLDAASEEILEAQRLEPGNANAWGWQSTLEAARGDMPRAIELARKQAALGNPIGHVQAAIYLMSSDIDAADRELRLAISMGSQITEYLLPLIDIAHGKESALDQFLVSLQSDRAPIYLATAGLLALGKVEEVLVLMDSDRIRGPMIHATFWSKANSRLRQDPRFVEYLTASGIPPLWRELGLPPDCTVVDGEFTCGHEGDPGGAD